MGILADKSRWHGNWAPQAFMLLVFCIEHFNATTGHLSQIGVKWRIERYRTRMSYHHTGQPGRTRSAPNRPVFPRRQRVRAVRGCSGSTGPSASRWLAEALSQAMDSARRRVDMGCGRAISRSSCARELACRCGRRAPVDRASANWGRIREAAQASVPPIHAEDICACPMPHELLRRAGQP